MRFPCVPRRLLVVALLVVTPCGVVASSAPGTRTVDFRFGIPTWHQPLGVPGDWHKPLANERGALLYDFGPGPYVQPITTVEATATGEPLAWERQEWIDGPRFPAVRTHFKRGTTATMEVSTWALPPGEAAASNGRTTEWERLDGITGALGWAKPPAGASPEFRNVAWGITRPVHYRVRVSPGATKRVMLGFNESYKLRLYDRTADMRVEGAPPLAVDLGLNAELNQPQVFLFEGTDADRDGWIDIAVMAPIGRDPNTTLAAIAVYPAGLTLTRAELIAGANGTTDKAELRIACGTEMRRQPARTDIIHAAYTGEAQPALVITTRRELGAGPEGAVMDGTLPFVLTQPRASRSDKTDTGWRLEFPTGTKEITAYVLSGAVTESQAAATRRLDWAKALYESRAQWAKIAIPYGHLTVADEGIQHLVDSAVRTLYQARESINGQPQFNSSFTLYRGLWAGDANDISELASMLGDSRAARETLGQLWSFQDAGGLIDELPPQRIFRGTPMVLLSMERDAQISGNWDFVKAKWPNVRRGNAALRQLRDQTLATPTQPYAGLFPPGFNDGGIIDITAEYSSLYWTMIGLEASQRMAKAIGEEKDAAEFAQFAQELSATFQKYRPRDQRRDNHGNLYLPVRVNVQGPETYPSLAQWAVVQALVFSRWLPLDSDFARGTYAMLLAAEKQGLPASTGWLPNGIWAGYGALFGHLSVVMDQPEKAADQLYAIANHASPRGTWVEEQSLKGEPLKLAGDQPHCWASTMFVRLAGFMLAHDRGDTLHLLRAVPKEWLRPGAINRLDDWHTGAGSLTLSLVVSADGNTATLNVQPVKRSDKKPSFLVHLDSLARAGFVLANRPAGEPLAMPASAPVALTFTKSARE